MWIAVISYVDFYSWSTDERNLNDTIQHLKESELEGVLAIPNGVAIPNTPPFMIDTANMAFFICSLMARFLCMTGTQQYCPERAWGLC